MASNDMHQDKDKDVPKELLHFSGCPKEQEFIPECEVVVFEKADSLDTLYTNCIKNPGHINFIPVDQVREEDLPPEHRTPEVMKEIFRSCVLTVRVKVPYTSEDRPESFCDNMTPYPYYQHRGRSKVVRYGTGTIAEVFYYQPVVGKPCPCPVCEKSTHPETVFWWVCVRTATHVIYDSAEARCAQFDCFYHSDDREGVKTLYGFDTFNIVSKHDDHYRNDACHVWCVTHDHETVAILNRMHPSKKFIHVPDSKQSSASSKIMISHPHGCSKRITVGNTLHLTVPVGLDYPVNTPIYFSQGAKYRKPVNYANYVKQEGEKQIKTPDDNSSHPEFPTMKTLVEEVKKSPEYKNNRAMSKREKLTNLDSDMDQIYSRESYMVDFYFLFIRHCSLMHVFTTVVNERRKEGWGEKATEKAVKDIFRIFFNKEYPHPALDTSSGAGPGTQDRCLQHWVNLLKGSGAQFTEDRSDKDMRLSPFLEIFVKFRQEKFSLLLDMMTKDRHACQCYVIDLMPTMKVACTQAFSRLEETERGTLGESWKITNDDKDTNDDDNNNDNDNNYNSDDEKGFEIEDKLEKDGEHEDDDKNEEDKENEEGGGEEIIPEGSTFTLASNAEYAFRVYSQSPGWIHFHPGTVMTFPDGTQKQIGEPCYLFHELSVSLYRGFVTYSTNTCPGSSGAAVKFDLMDNFSRTYFPHSGYQNGMNRSGMQRECGHLVYPKLFVPPAKHNH